MRLPSAPARYDEHLEDVMRQLIEQEFDRLRSEIANIASNDGQQLLRRSPNGTKYKITVDNSGNLVVTAY